MRAPAPRPSRARPGGAGPRVLAARLDNVGDVILSGPAVRALATDAEVTYLCSPASSEAAGLLPGVSQVMTMSAPWVGYQPPAVDPEDLARFVDRVRRRAFDAAVIFTSFHQSPLPLALLLRSAGVARIAAISVDYPGSLLDVRHHVEDDLHEVERGLSLARAAGYELSPCDQGRLGLRPVATWAERPSAPYVVIHPGASVPARAWRPSGYAAVARALACAGWVVVVTGGATEKPLTSQVTPRSGIDLGGSTTLPELSAVLKEASVVVTGNTGPAHLAAAVGTPVVSLYAPTVPAVRWRPWGVDHLLLGDGDIACAGCRSRECPVPGHPCLGSVDPDEVVSAVELLVARNNRGRRHRVQSSAGVAATS